MVRRFFLKAARRRTLERDLDAELAFHREMAEAGGNCIPLGSAARIKEASGDPWRFTLLESIWLDVVYSVRGLCRCPALVFLAVLAVTLGVGSATAVFSIVNTVLLKPLPVYDPDRLVVLLNTGVGPKGERANSPAASPAKFAHWRAQSSVLEDVSAYVLGAINYGSGDAVEQVRFIQVSEDFFRCMGTPILQGRGFTPEEDTPNGPHVALISQDFWISRLAGDPRILGQTIELSGDAYTVIGILAKNPNLSEFGPTPAVVVPFQLDPNSRNQGHYFTVVARLKPGVSLQQAQARLQASAGEYLAKFHAGLGPRNGFSVMPYQAAAVGNTGSLLMVLMGAVGLVLLIAFTNVANLLLVRAAGRRREIAIRASIGAGRGRVIRQLLIESVLLSLTGGVLGLLLGYAGIRALLAVNTAGLSRVGENGVAVGMDWRVAGFALAVSLLTGIVFGLFPALKGSRADLSSALRDSAGRSGTGLKQNKVRAALVVSEVSLAVILLVGSVLLIRTFVALYSVDPGFDTKNVITMHSSLTGPKFSTPAGVTAAVHDGLERIHALPGVVAETAACCVPLEGGFMLPINIGGAATSGPSGKAAGWMSISPGYFDVFKIPVKRGRAFTEADDENSPPVALINETMAKQYWTDADPLADPMQDRVGIVKGVAIQFNDEPARQIIGIVGDIHDTGLNRKPGPIMYVPTAQLSKAINAPNIPMAWVVRAQTDPAALIPAMRERVRQATGMPVFDVKSMDEVVALSTARQRFNMLLMTVFAGVAALLAAIGIYGLMAYAVKQRTQDFGIRLALGAEPGQIRSMVVRQGLWLALVGVVLGLAGAWALARSIESLLFGVNPRDPIAFLAVPLALTMVALLAVWFPARRAGQIDAVEALRYE
jgi:putative ABC transport system permease protein